jgi:hypothetical protein
MAYCIDIRVSMPVMEKSKNKNLKRPRYPMPAFVKEALLQRGLMDAYRCRPQPKKENTR